MISFFDFHLHPLFKNFLSGYEPWIYTSKCEDELTMEIDMTSNIVRLIDETVLHILQSQSAVDQIQKGSLLADRNLPRIAVSNLANFEYGFADSRGFFGKLLKSKITKPLDTGFLKKIKQGEVSYYRMLLKELYSYVRLVELSKEKENNNNRYRFISRKTIDSLVDFEGETGFLMSLEGGHNLCMMKVGRSTVFDEVTEDEFLDPDNNSGIDLSKDPLAQTFLNSQIRRIDPVGVLRNLHKAVWEQGADFLYLTLTHLTHIPEQLLATHAFGLKLLKHPAFYPHGKGLTRLGENVIDAAYRLRQNKDGKEIETPILIDIKHMSLVSRQEFYKLRKQKQKLDEQTKALYSIPIVASHMGVTGYSINDWKNAMMEDDLMVHVYEGARNIGVTMEREFAGKWGSAINNSFTYNPWSINLMDEDIIEILESNGLIGLSLDVRILGFQSKVNFKAKNAPEYLSMAEFKELFPYISIQNLPFESFESMATEAESWLVPTKEERHPLCLAFNIIHIQYVGKMNDPDCVPTRQMCIGSDFDGLIDPIKICDDSSKMGDLAKNLIKWLPVAADAYQKEHGGPDSIYAFTKDLKELRNAVENIMFKNGGRFVQGWLKGDYSLIHGLDNKDQNIPQEE